MLELVTDTGQQDQPQRVTSLDVVKLTNIERVAVLVHLAGHSDPVVATAVLDAVERVLARTRPGGE